MTPKPQLRDFPPEAKNALPDARALHSRHGEELWIDRGDIHEGRSRRITELTTRFGDLVLRFADLENVRAVPVRIADYQRDMRSLLQKFFGIGKSERKQNAASCDLDDNGIPVELERDFGSASDGLLLIDHADPKALESLYPGATVETVQQAQLVTFASKPKPVYSEVSSQSINYKDRVFQNVIDRRNEEHAPSPLSPEARAIIGQYGRIVYESDPRNTDRVIVCVRHLHGNDGDAASLDLVDPAYGALFVAHQRGIQDMMDALVAHHGVERSKLVLETFEANSMEWSRKTSASFDVVEWDNWLANNDFRAHFTKHLGSLGLTVTPEQLASLCDLVDQPSRAVFPVLQRFLEAKQYRSIIGDGRPQSRERHEANDALRDDKRSKMLEFMGQAGVAADLAALQSEEHREVFDEAHRVLLREVTAKLQQGQMCLVPYGAAHFNVGNIGTSEAGNPLEKYFGFVPRAQVIVVEETHYEALNKAFKNMFDLIKSLPHKDIKSTLAIADGYPIMHRQALLHLYDVLDATNPAQAARALRTTLEYLRMRETCLIAMKTIYGRNSQSKEPPPSTSPKTLSTAEIMKLYWESNGGQ